MEEPIRQIRSRTIALPREDIDTDQILPARYLTATTSDGLGPKAFEDWRYRPDGSVNPDCPLNQVDLRTHRIIVAGHNFGCGSSREHAAWALKDLGIAAVISSGIADIFSANALQNGLVPVAIDAETNDRLLATPGAEVTIDIESGELRTEDGLSRSFDLEPFSRYCLLQGTDRLGFLLSLNDEIDAFEKSHR